jgi:phage tail-like protein
VALTDFRKEVIIELFNEAGQPVKAFIVHRCWPSEYQALPDLEANSSAIAIETLKLENEGWERDEFVVEPKEP